MNHTLENALVTGAILTVFVLPVIIIAQHAKRKRKAALIEALQTSAHKIGLQLIRYDYLENKIIGWDSDKHTVVFIYATKAEPTVIDLEEVGKCYTLRKMSGSDVLSITLQLTDRDNKVIHSLSFYEQFIDNELQIKNKEASCRQWERLINEKISLRPHKIAC